MPPTARRSPRCDGAVDETRRDRAAPRRRFPGAAGHDRRRQGPSRRLRASHRRLRRSGAVFANAPRFRLVARRGDIALRSHSGPLRRHAAFHRARPAKRLPPRRSARSGSRSSARSSRPAISSASSISRASSISTPSSARIRARVSSAAPAASIVCPTGAISPAGNHVAIDPYVCAGCGSCASVCPTGAAEYALPPADALMRRVRTLMLAYRNAGGRDGVVLFHDGDHGEPLIDALARFGDGLPANVLPVRVNEVTQVGPRRSRRCSLMAPSACASSPARSQSTIARRCRGL